MAELKQGIVPLQCEPPRGVDWVARRSNGDNVIMDFGSSTSVDATLRAQELLEAATAATAPGPISFDLYAAATGERDEQ